MKLRHSDTRYPCAYFKKAIGFMKIQYGTLGSYERSHCNMYIFEGKKIGGILTTFYCDSTGIFQDHFNYLYLLFFLLNFDTLGKCYNWGP